MFVCLLEMGDLHCRCRSVCRGFVLTPRVNFIHLTTNLFSLLYFTSPPEVRRGSPRAAVAERCFGGTAIIMSPSSTVTKSCRCCYCVWMCEQAKKKCRLQSFSNCLLKLVEQHLPSLMQDSLNVLQIVDLTPFFGRIPLLCLTLITPVTHKSLWMPQTVTSWGSHTLFPHLPQLVCNVSE